MNPLAEFANMDDRRSSAQRRPRILVVDDDELDRRAARQFLTQGFQVVEAENGTAAMALLDNENVDCVVLDYNIPGTDTWALLAECNRRLPVVMLAGVAEAKMVAAMFKAGALDYLSKDDLTFELLSTAIRRAIRKRTIQRQRKVIHNRLRVDYRSERKKRNELESELMFAREIQQSLIPASSPRLKHFDIAAAYLPSEATSGDFYDFIAAADGDLRIVMADVSGHGLGPALLAAEIRAYVRSLAHAGFDIAEIMTIANHMLWEDTHGELFATLFLAEIHDATRSLTVASAGHQSFIVHCDGTITVLNGTVVPLGVDSDMQIPSARQLQLEIGDILLSATDGLSDSESPCGAPFGIDAALEIARGHTSDSADEIVRQVIAACRHHRREEPQHDDITIVVMKTL